MHLMKTTFTMALVCLTIGAVSTNCWAQKATITEETRAFATYPFDDPNPIPVLSTNTKIYPYHTFDGYNHLSEQASWKVITLENEYIQVFVLPEVGGKVWGAIDKTTGQEFIYRNEVMKFRNISMRGPWTSGGIEFNFGIIGHHPSTATPVDYQLTENEDGSVSCIVGNIDLPSRTHWRVIITLSPDKSYFETKVLWYNPGPHVQSYYNWMTAAAFATEDLEFYTPGNQYLTHPGEAKPWPVDNLGHNLARYAENNFGGSKSYHVVGEYNDFFGGYYHDEQYGFGHWSTYEDSPGQKLWLWALSRSGGIWEDLLTDDDGQYIEFQAGRLFDQYSPGKHKNPITQVPFGSYYSDTWRELWFPFNKIGGLTDVSPQAAMNIKRKDDKVIVGINALSEANGIIEVKSSAGDQSKTISLVPAQVIEETFTVPAAGEFEVLVKALDLHYKSGSQENQLDRPFEYPDFDNENAATEAYRLGLEDMQYREFESARMKFEQCLEQDPSHVEARVELAGILLRNTEYQEAQKHAKIALSIDTYRPMSNYVAANIYRALGDYVNAMESFGWAARSLEYRSAAYTQMAEMTLAKGKLLESKELASKALDFNRYNISALQVLAVVARKTDNQEQALSVLGTLLQIDPLNHLGHYEMALYHQDYPVEDHFRSELVQQTYLELAITYFNMGQRDTAIEIFSSIDNPVAKLWVAYLEQKDIDKSLELLEQVKNTSINFVFPFRSESVDVFEWAEKMDTHWKFKYYLGLIYWSKNRLAEAARLMNLYRSNPDESVFYLTRADLLYKFDHTDQLQDLNKAFDLDPENWRVWDRLVDYYFAKGRYPEALDFAESANKKWPENYNLGLAYARALLENHLYGKCMNQLEKVNVLPFEGASTSRTIYERAHLGEALQLIEKGQYKKSVSLLEDAKIWPENLGVGKPFSPEQRQIDFLQGLCYKFLGQTSNQETSQQALEQFTVEHFAGGHPANILGLLSMKDSGSETKAEEIVTALEKENSLPNQWVVAQYRQDLPAIKQLSIEVDKLDPLGFEMLKKMIQLHNQQ